MSGQSPESLARAAQLIDMAGQSPVGLKRCLGHEVVGQPHILVSRDTCHEPCCFHISAVRGNGDAELAEVAAILELEVYESNVQQPTVHGCAPWPRVRDGV